MSRLEQNAYLAVAFSREHIWKYDLKEMHHIYCFEKPEIINEYAMRFLVHRESAYFNELNRFIELAAAGGLIERWHSISRIQSHHQYKEKYAHYNLHANRFFGVIIILSGAIAFAFLIFLLEIFINRKVRSLNPNQFWIYADMCLNSERYFLRENKFD